MVAMDTVVEVIAAAKSVALTDGWTGDERGDVQGDGCFNGVPGDDGGGFDGGDGGDGQSTQTMRSAGSHLQARSHAAAPAPRSPKEWRRRGSDRGKKLRIGVKRSGSSRDRQDFDVFTPGAGDL